MDQNFLLFTNLEELTLSANFIQDVYSQHLPPTLQVSSLICIFKRQHLKNFIFRDSGSGTLWKPDIESRRSVHHAAAADPSWTGLQQTLLDR